LVLSLGSGIPSKPPMPTNLQSISAGYSCSTSSNGDATTQSDR
jgi:hypothetical protein